MRILIQLRFIIAIILRFKGRNWQILPVFLFMAMSVAAQKEPVDTARSLPGVVIHGERIKDYAIGMKSIPIDSLSLRLSQGDNLGELLSRNTSLFFKTYGQGGMSSAAFRGTTSSQSGVFWNGFNIEGRSTAMTDLSLVPSFFFNKVEVLYGGSASLFGSGNIGGSIHFREQPSWFNGIMLDAGLSYGSFGDVEPRLKLQLSNQKWSSVTALLFHQAKNDFPYSFGGNEKVQQNAAIETRAFYQQLDHRFNNIHSLNLALWLQEDDRELPPPAIGSASIENRTDRSLRFSSRWKALAAYDLIISAGLAMLHDDLHYLNKTVQTAQVLVDSRIYNDVVMLEALGEKRFGKYWQLLVQMSFEDSRADVNSFGGKNYQQKGGLLISLKKSWKNPDWVTTLHVRQEWAEGYVIPVCPSAGVEGKLGKGVKIYANVSKNFRLPSLNDRFWVPGGNQDLLPETSLNGETGIQYSCSFNSGLSVDLQLSAFASSIQDQIVWIPQGSLWQAENVQKVAIKGLENRMKFIYMWANNKLTFDADYSYISSLNRNKSLPNDASVGKQQIYTPRHRAVAGINFSGPRWFVWLKTSYTGITYYSRDNVGYLPTYFLGDFGTNYRLPWRHVNGLEIGASVINIGDKQYQVIQYYPAPGRHFRININWNISSIRKTKT